MNCTSCSGSGYKRRRMTDGTFGEIDCPRCGGTGEVADPNAPERTAEAITRIAVALERIADKLDALTSGAGNFRVEVP